MRAKLFVKSFVGAMAQEPNYGLLCCSIVAVIAVIVIAISIKGL